MPLEESLSTEDEAVYYSNTGVLKTTIWTEQCNNYYPTNSSAVMCINLTGKVVRIPIPFAIAKKIQMEADGLCYGEGVQFT